MSAALHASHGRRVAAGLRGRTTAKGDRDGPVCRSVFLFSGSRKHRLAPIQAQEWRKEKNDIHPPPTTTSTTPSSPSPPDPLLPRPLHDRRRPLVRAHLPPPATPTLEHTNAVGCHATSRSTLRYGGRLLPSISAHAPPSSHGSTPCATRSWVRSLRRPWIRPPCCPRDRIQPPSTHAATSYCCPPSVDFRCW
ncbi:uncharacterized protein [Triticum aestivum]|uniref:uncharacterized protein n=1 Tax=Triticum aestivum TaxID=4565 RepID=UPI001D01D498|nr:uncharacterized protein LOC123102957 [Triticum aestivum]